MAPPPAAQRETTTTPKEAVLHEYVAHELYAERVTRLCAEAATYRLARRFAGRGVSPGDDRRGIA